MRSRVLSIYTRIARTYLSSAGSLLLIATIIFVPVGLVHSIALHADIGSFSLSSNLEVAAVFVGLAALTLTGLIGEVFYSGVVAVSLTHPQDGRSPSLREIAGWLDYRSLILADVIFGVAVTVGLALLVVPGVLAFVWLGLAGPIVEIEGHGVRAALRRSVELVRGNFWFVFWVLVPIELVGDGVARLATAEVHHLLGDALPAIWLAEVLANVLLTPIYAIAAVLLTVELVVAKEGVPPQPRAERVSA